MKNLAFGLFLLIAGCYNEDGTVNMNFYFAFTEPSIVSPQYGIMVYYEAKPEFTLEPEDYDFVWQGTQLCTSIFKDTPPVIIITDELHKFCGKDSDDSIGRLCLDPQVVLIRVDYANDKSVLSHEFIHDLLVKSGRTAESRNHEPAEYFQHCPSIFGIKYKEFSMSE